MSKSAEEFLVCCRKLRRCIMQWAWTWILRTKAVVAEVCTVWERSGRHYFTRRHLLNRRSEVSSLCKTMFKTAWFTGKCDPARLRMVKLRCGRGSVLLFQHFNTLCTSGFVDDVITGQAKANGEKASTQSDLSGGATDQGRSLMFTIAHLLSKNLLFHVERRQQNR